MTAKSLRDHALSSPPADMPLLTEIASWHRANGSDRLATAAHFNERLPKLGLTMQIVDELVKYAAHTKSSQAPVKTQPGPANETSASADATHSLQRTFSPRRQDSAAVGNDDSSESEGESACVSLALGGNPSQVCALDSHTTLYQCDCRRLRQLGLHRNVTASDRNCPANRPASRLSTQLVSAGRDIVPPRNCSSLSGINNPTLH